MQLRNSTTIGNFCKPYIVAEMNTSHFGSIETAKNMIVAAKESGCNCVKFQSWTQESLYSQDYYDSNPMAKRFVKGFSLNENQLIELLNFSKDQGIDFTSTPYSNEEVDFLASRSEVPFIKVSSMELTNLRFLNYIGKKQLPVVLSTGMGQIDEIEVAVNALTSSGNESICLLHCISLYPHKIEQTNIKNISMLQTKFPNLCIGFSDHSMTSITSMAAVALGAALIEKHFTLDRSRIGMDNNMALEPGETKDLVVKCHSVWSSMGSYERIVSEEEEAQKIKMRRSVIASKTLNEGDILTEECVDFKRPGTGISPVNLNKILGKKVIKKIDPNKIIQEEDLE